MTGRTHDLVAFTALNIVLVSLPQIPKFSIATGLTALSVVCIGALAPDIDQPTADLWRRVPTGTIWGKILYPLFGGHRFVSHSLVGAVLFGFLTKLIFGWMGTWILVDMTIVWWAFMIGFVSHLLIDSITKEGVPWLFPVPFRMGFPPVKFLRVKTGGIIEKYIIFPGLLLANGFLIFSYYDVYKNMFRLMLQK